MQYRYKLGSTVKGTRNCHHFEPVSSHTIKGKHLSIETNVSIVHSFNCPQIQSEIASSLQVNDYATCIFDNFCWLVLIDAINEEENDITCRFMHPHGLTNKFYWPSTDDKAYVPYSKFILKVKTPSCAVDGWQYNLDPEEVKSTQLSFDKINEIL